MQIYSRRAGVLAANACLIIQHHFGVLLNDCFSVWRGAHTAEQPLNSVIKIHRHLIWCEVTITRQSATSVRINRHVSSTALGDMLIGSLMMRTHDHDVPQENSTQDKKTKRFNLRWLIRLQVRRGLPPHLAEVHVDVFTGLLVKLRAADLLREVGDADGVAGVQLLHQEIAAGLDHAVDLVHDGAVHHVDHALLPHRDAGRIGEFYQSVHNLNPRRGQNYRGKG